MKFFAANKSSLRFIGIFLGLYLAWIMLYEWLIQPWAKLDKLVINDNSLWSVFILEKLGYRTFIDPNPTLRTVGIDGTHGLWIGDPCDGLTLFALFTCFILAYPGSWKHKLWFIPAGITVIHFMNIFRVVALCIILLKHPSWLEFNHTYLFQVIMYGIIFLMWYLWIVRFSGKKITVKTNV